MSKKSYQRVLAEEQLKFSKEAIPLLEEEKLALEDLVVCESIRRMKAQGVKTIKLVPFHGEKNHLDGTNLVFDPFNDQIDLAEFQPYCNPKLYQQYLDVIAALRELQTTQ